MTSIYPAYQPFDEAEMRRFPEQIWRGVNALAVHSLFHTMNLFDVMRARSTERFVDIEVAQNIAYSDEHSRWRRLDIWRPTQPSATPRPALLFVHGGGFRTMSKRTHWFFARAFARMGYVVFTADYRLGPEHKYPAPLEDVCEAFCWMTRHAADHGADMSRVVLAGESAGANLITALAIATTHRRQEAFARRVFDTQVTPVALLPMCGMLQLKDIERYARSGASRLVLPALRDAARSYVGAEALMPAPERANLSDPLLVAEQAQEPERPLPDLLACVGESDPLVQDTMRLAASWRAQGAMAKTRTYTGGGHSFMAFMWTRRAQRCWKDMSNFLKLHVPGDPVEPPQQRALSA